MEIDSDIGDLHAAAVDAQAHAHCPYSDYPVGAAIRTPSGRIFSGCNVENAAYPEGSCAETAAIAAMVAAGERTIVEIVVVTDGDVPGTPCGGCRQRIREFARPDTRIHATTARGVSITSTMSSLLPDSFGPERLGHNT
jgi:cytidine deaminase